MALTLDVFFSLGILQWEGVTWVVAGAAAVGRAGGGGGGGGGGGVARPTAGGFPVTFFSFLFFEKQI
jgi:hypothetical protein